ncbi:Os05g0340800 [Oryza sativa Japonica Group]|uniref:Os05g0340800 protein n=1 Tax=Oryza sativa subsp. japonica TaxID=39947 RepID=A0A0P0WL02_ORYSJ|nr:Os05g0340800 [Oryza sativa Japonica Group]
MGGRFPGTAEDDDGGQRRIWPPRGRIRCGASSRWWRHCGARGDIGGGNGAGARGNGDGGNGVEFIATVAAATWSAAAARWLVDSIGGCRLRWLWGSRGRGSGAELVATVAVAAGRRRWGCGWPAARWSLAAVAAVVVGGGMVASVG